MIPTSICIKGASKPTHSKAGRASCVRRTATIHCALREKCEEPVAPKVHARREIMLNSFGGVFLASVFNFSGELPSNLGLKDYGNFKSLALCPPTPNCISTAEEANNYTAFVPAWTFKQADSIKYRGKTTEEAMVELKEAVLSCNEGKFTATIVNETPNYLKTEFQSSIFGFVDDVEFYFHDDQVEYRSASRLGKSDGDANRKRIRALRKALEKKGWRSTGF